MIRGRVSPTKIDFHQACICGADCFQRDGACFLAAFFFNNRSTNVYESLDRLLSPVFVRQQVDDRLIGNLVIGFLYINNKVAVILQRFTCSPGRPLAGQ